uniref:Uncharacterized protein n=1 Tax=Cacopsylla melanoneura TaxID=428564 RepID=A0A8D9EU36_9HEMI
MMIMMKWSKLPKMFNLTTTMLNNVLHSTIIFHTPVLPAVSLFLFLCPCLKNGFSGVPIPMYFIFNIYTYPSYLPALCCRLQKLTSVISCHIKRQLLVMMISTSNEIYCRTVMMKKDLCCLNYTCSCLISKMEKNPMMYLLIIRYSLFCHLKII